MRTASRSAIGAGLSVVLPTRPWTSSASRIWSPIVNTGSAPSSAPENQRDLGAANLAHIAFAQVEEIAALETDAAAANAPGGCTSRMIEKRRDRFPAADSPTSPAFRRHGFRS
jgi:hypothetical protein